MMNKLYRAMSYGCMVASILTFLMPTISPEAVELTFHNGMLVGFFAWLWMCGAVITTYMAGETSD